MGSSILGVPFGGSLWEGLGVDGDGWDGNCGCVSLEEEEEGVFVVVVSVAGVGLRRGDLNGLASVDEGDDMVVFRRRRLGLGVGVWLGVMVFILFMCFLG